MESLQQGLEYHRVFRTFCGTYPKKFHSNITSQIIEGIQLAGGCSVVIMKTCNDCGLNRIVSGN